MTSHREGGATSHPDTTPALARATEALVQYETSDMCRPGKKCQMCDCAVQNMDRSELDEDLRRNLDRTRYTVSAALHDPDDPLWLERTIWETSRADEGTISATGANHVAASIRATILGGA